MANGRDALWETGHDESVEVNQRALIDKVLARYSGEFTVFRELLQNSDDAQSKAVEIHFETQKFIDQKNGKRLSSEIANPGKEDLPDMKTALVHQWTFRNNGIVFRDEDWNRLKKIAEGNPDEEKIGAFGVGFYSLFSVTEEPFVTSGGQWMGFYWKDKKDQLFARRGTLQDHNASGGDLWTSFEMRLREATPIPGPFDFTRFLASSITFMAHLSQVSVYFDDKRLARLTKSAGVPKMLDLPKGIQRSSRMGIMNVTGVKATPLHITAEVLRWVYSTGSERPPAPPVIKQTKPTTQGGFFSSIFSTRSAGSTPRRSVINLPAIPAEAVDPLTVNETSVVLSIFSADVNVRLDQKIAAELHRSTKKNPPSKLKYELIYTAKDEYDSSVKEDEKLPFATGSVFQGLRADVYGTGSARIFIGHATAQTTGLGGHMAARFIPTVERESIDLVDRNVAVWNRELLYVGGLLARTAYELEVATVRELWENASSSTAFKLGPDPELRAWLCKRSLHALQFVAFHPSTPSVEVSSLMEAAFFACQANQPFPIISSAGVRSAAEVRLPDATFSGFLKDLPVLPDDVLNGASRMVAALQSRGMVKAITFADVLKELRSRPLGEEEMVACLQWWISLNKQGDNPNLAHIRTDLLNAAVLMTGTGSPNERILPLSAVKTFINAKNIMGAAIPTDGPLPDHVIPLSVTKALMPEALVSYFPWTELSTVDWLKHLIAPAAAADVQYDITRSAAWAERVLSILSRSWPSLSNGMKEHIALLLKDKTCIPTSAGLRTPEQSYFANVNIFHDLPIVTLPSGTIVKGPMEKVLQTLGVRKHVDLQVVFNRMIKTGDWTIADLTKYLVAVRSTLNDEEIMRLRKTAAFPSENSRVGDNQRKPARYKANDLYEPLDIFRQLKLPVIDWGGPTKWRGTSEEAKFLFELGLRRFPPLEVLIDLCASNDTTIRPVALKYLLDNISTRYPDYHPMNFAEVPFIPATSRMGTPKEVFGNPEWAALGILVVHPSIQQDATSKLKISEHPPPPMLVEILRKTPPKNYSEARKWFEILAGRIAYFSSQEYTQLFSLPIVPITDIPNVPGAPETRWLPPSRCFFGGDSRAQFHSKLFVFVDFGQLANSFLSACGTKREPSVEEIAQILLADPRKFYELADGRDNFLGELRNIAVNVRNITQVTMNKMKVTPILLGMKRNIRGKSNAGRQRSDSIDVDEEDWDMQYDLRKPNQIIVVDDNNAYHDFGDSIFTAPQEDILEGFYTLLGSPRLSSLVKEEYKPSAELKDTRMAAEVRHLILERLPLFLHEHTHAKTRISYGWLNTGSNFMVKTFGKLTVTKSLHHGDVRLSRVQEASAVAKRIGFGSIHLWLAGNAQLDMYEVATSLCRLLFESPKANDALLFMTILSTDLRSLKRRGYNVDRILRQQKIDRQAVENIARQKAENTALVPANPRDDAFTPAPPPTQPTDSLSITSDTSDNAPVNPRPPSTFLQNWKRKFNSTIHLNNSEKGHLPLDNVDSPPSILNNTRPTRAGGHNVTPLSNISSNIDMAIKACTPETKHLLQNREQMQQVRESLNEGYCDISGRVGDLTLIGRMGEVKVFAPREVPNPMSIMTVKHDQLARFIHIMRPLAQVYKLPLTTLHIYYDIAGDLIAFNRNGSIFLNLRYFEAWHDEDVLNGIATPAYISWYFTLAHEIAHNLVQPHNSEHEFYFSAICERYILEFGKLVSDSRA